MANAGEQFEPLHGLKRLSDAESDCTFESN